ncbi:MAG: flagellar assembly protein T N-terminal domain-containing protein [Pseudomonadota bacterium]
MRWFLALWMLWAVPACASEGFWVETEGLAAIHSSADQDSARRRALGEALVSAALAGGASLDGHTVMHNARVLSDVAILRPLGRVLRYDLVSAEQTGRHWRVQVRALVGPRQSTVCVTRRRFTVDILPPEIFVPPQAQAWTAPIAQEVANRTLDVLRDHPALDVQSFAAPQRPRVDAALDYRSLFEGILPARGQGNQTVNIRVAIDGRGARTTLLLALRLTGPDGRATERRFTRSARASSDGLTALVSHARRPRAEAALLRSLSQEVRGFLDELSCRPAEARLKLSGAHLSVDLGHVHGLRRSTIAFLDDPRNTFGLLEIVSVDARRAVLRPLDPTQSAASLAGRRVQFLGAPG